MTTGTQSRNEESTRAEPPEAPEISTCETRPGRTVFMEAGNSDGWLSSDHTVDVTR